tara:strand:+ start:19154 stop:20761 length:1608 start_codon:yes stop_codon:yes gene_type:complete
LGSALAGSWYAGTSAIFSGSAAQAISIIGAIAVSGITPILMVKNRIRRDAQSDNQSLLQRLQAFNTHAIVNIVDSHSLLTEVNDHLLQLTGYSRDDLIGQPVSKLYDQEFQVLAASIREKLVQGQSWQGETPLRCADGRIVYTQTTVMPLVDCDGKWVGSISARTDVTRANELQAEHDITETLYELRDDIWIIDAQTEGFAYMNRSAMRRCGWSTETYSQKTISDIATHLGCDDITTACRALVHSKSNMTHIETMLGDCHFKVTIKLLDINGSGGRFLVMLQDISEIVDQERMKSEFISMVSHELRSPLTSIKGSMGLLLSRAAGDLPEKARALLEISHRNADRLVLIINDILDLEKIANGRLEFNLDETDIGELLAETRQANAALEQRFGVRLETQLPENAISITTDPNRIIQVLTNLLSNAAKFSKPNDRIIIKVEDAVEEIRISVTDKGPGIPMADQDKVFQRFADMSNSDRNGKGGTGLGLSVCKAIVENLGGKIGFDSREGFGTTFFFTLPKTIAKVAQQETAAQLRVAS